jgi:hypothetical protein
MQRAHKQICQMKKKDDVMTDNLETFPQAAATSKPGKGKPSIAQLLDQAETREQALALVRTAYPDATQDEIAAAIEEHCAGLRAEGDRLTGEAEAMLRVEEIVSRDSERTANTPLGESLERLAAQGDEEAAAVLSRISSPWQRAREFWLDRAVERDPYWTKTDRGYKVRPGARYSDPEELIDAYVIQRGEKEALLELPDDLMREVSHALASAEIARNVREHLAEGKLERTTDETEV